MTTDELLGELTDEIETLAGRDDGRVFIGIVGAPGGGKSTLAALVHERLGTERSVLVPMDGFHLAQNVIAGTPLQSRRGAIDTFDGWGYLHLLRRLASPDAHPVYAPTYRRGLEDPIAGSIEILPSVRIVITEGNYLLADQEPWRQVREVLTRTWYVDTDETERVERLIQRHIRYGMTPDAARAWASGPDAANARLVLATRARADRIVPWP